MKKLQDIKSLDDMIGNVINADCLEVMKMMPNKSVDLILTDPPYGINYEYDIYVDNLDNLKSISSWIDEMKRISNLVVIFCNHRNLWIFPQADWVMNYNWNTTGSYCPMGVCQWQPILVYGKDIKGFGSINGIIKSDTIRISGGGGVGFMRKEEINHPCPKPLNIMQKLVQRLSNETDLVFDPFLGSGTTALACEQLNRRWIGCEISEKYCKVADDRVMAYRNQTKLF